MLRRQEGAELVSENKADFDNLDNWYTTESDIWYSTHTSVYKISSRELSLFLHEGFDGQTETHPFSLLDTHFEKPLEKQL